MATLQWQHRTTMNAPTGQQRQRYRQETGRIPATAVNVNMGVGIFNAIPEDKVAVVEKFGRFQRIAWPGFLFLPVPGVWSIAGYLSLRLQEIHVRVKTKTKDNVFVKIVVAVHLEVIREEQALYDAFYKLANPAHQIQSYVEDVVRASVPTMDLDRIFFEKQEMANHIFEALQKEMMSYGYKICSALVIDIDPNPEVKETMNSMNAEKRKRIAAAEISEAEKVMQIKKAEAEAEAAYLQGEGLAKQRRAIVDGTRESVLKFEAMEGTFSPKEVMHLMMVTQYFDTMKELGSGSSASVVMVPKRKRGSGAVKEIVNIINKSK